MTPLEAMASLNCILQQGLRSIRWFACVAGDPVPENSVRVCRSVEQHGKLLFCLLVWCQELDWVLSRQLGVMQTCLKEHRRGELGTCRGRERIAGGAFVIRAFVKAIPP